VAKPDDAPEQKITILKNGPYRVSGNIPLRDEIVESNEIGVPFGWKAGREYPHGETYSLCRCGKSRNKPFCDDAHIHEPFDGTETAPDVPFQDQAQTITGPGLVLDDAREFCAAARFCFRSGGIWKLVRESDDPEKLAMAKREAFDCPAGRLVVRDKETKAAMEPGFDASISVIQDEASECPGTLWVKGGVAVYSADGKKYETRNRVTLCGCGNSANKPFCDGSHVRAGC